MAVDPISLSASIITLADTGFSIGQFLLDTFKAYKNAPEDILEIKHEIELSCAIMMPLAEKLHSGACQYNAGYQESVAWLVENSLKILQSLRQLILVSRDGDLGTRRRWDFVLNKSKIASQRKRLRDVQQMFIFMTAALVAAGPGIPGVTAFEGPGPEHFPITLTGTGRDSNGNPVSYSAQVTMQQLRPSRPAAKARARQSQQTRPRDLVALRQSPYFSAALLTKARKPSVHFDEDEKGKAYKFDPRPLVLSEDVARKEVESLVDIWFGGGRQKPETERQREHYGWSMPTRRSPSPRAGGGARRFSPSSNPDRPRPEGRRYDDGWSMPMRSAASPEATGGARRPSSPSSFGEQNEEAEREDYRWSPRMRPSPSPEASGSARRSSSPASSGRQGPDTGREDYGWSIRVQPDDPPEASGQARRSSPPPSPGRQRPETRRDDYGWSMPMRPNPGPEAGGGDAERYRSPSDSRRHGPETREEDYGWSIPMQPERWSEANDDRRRYRSPSDPGDRRYRSPEAPWIVCDSCAREINCTRYNCQSCSNFDLCRTCFEDPRAMMRLRHEHPQSHFVEQTGLFGDSEEEFD